MSDTEKGTGSGPGVPYGAREAPGTGASVATLQRVCFLEWRIEQITCALEDKERLLQQQRVELAESAQREVEASDRVGQLERLLADARRDAVLLGDRRALQVEMEQRLGDSEKVNLQAARMLRDLERERERSEASERALDAARERIAILETGRERFFTKLLEWQNLESSREGADLAQFIAELRSEIARLSSENAALAGREAALTKQVEGLRQQDDAAPAAWIGTSEVERAGPLEPRQARAPRPQAPPERPSGWPAGSDARVSGRPPAAQASPAPRSDSSEPTERAESIPAEVVPPPTSRSSAPPVSFDEVRAQLAVALGGTSRARNADRLLFELFGTNAALRGGAARALFHVAGEHAAPALTLALHAATLVDERVELVALLGRTGAPRVRGAIESAQRDLDPRVRAAALDALAAHARRDPEVLREPLERALEDAEPRVRRRAMVVLCALPRFDASSLLARVLEDEDGQIRRAACAGLARMQVQAPGVQRQLAGALLDPDLAVRRVAAKGLEPVFGDQVLRIPTLSESQRRRSVTALRERIAERSDVESPDEAPEQTSATRLYDLGRGRRTSERSARPGVRHRRPVLAAGGPAGSSE